MNTKYTIKNFKIFDEKGATFTISPITLLTGPNSAGKSSFVGSIVSLKSYLDKVKSYYNKNGFNNIIDALDQEVDVFGKNLSDGFSSVINEHSKTHSIVYSYQVQSLLLADVLDVEIAICSGVNNKLADKGILESFVMKYKGEVLYFIERDRYGLRLRKENINLIQDRIDVFFSRNSDCLGNTDKRIYKFLSSLLEETLINPTDYLSNVEFSNIMNLDKAPKFISFDVESTFGNLLKRYISSTDCSERQTCMGMPIQNINHRLQFTKKWINKLELGEDVKIDGIYDCNNKILGCCIYLKKGNTYRHLQEEGLGINQLFYILLYIDLCIQIKSKDSSFRLCLEEPEVHLHPKLQSALADIMLDASKENIFFIVETHSEYLIRKSQILVADLIKMEDNPFRVYYISKDEGAYEMEYDNLGRFNRMFGEGFYDEASNLDMDLYRRELKE